jgi:hypothetical protein
VKADPTKKVTFNVEEPKPKEAEKVVKPTPDEPVKRKRGRPPKVKPETTPETPVPVPTQFQLVKQEENAGIKIVMTRPKRGR